MASDGVRCMGYCDGIQGSLGQHRLPGASWEEGQERGESVG